MGMKTAIVIVASVGMAAMSAPLLPGVSFAQGAPAAMATAAMASKLPAADKDALIKKLQDAKVADKRRASKIRRTVNPGRLPPNITRKPPA